MTLAKSKPNTRWWVLAASSALLITALVSAVVYLVTKEPSVVDQLVIYTIPSGAEIKINGVSYGTSPVKLEQVKVGTYTLTISKDNYDTITEQISIADSTPIERKLKSALPTEIVGKSPAEQLQELQSLAEDYFARGRYANLGEDNAMRFVRTMLEIEPTNAYAAAKREEIRKALLRSAQSEINRGALGSAKEYYNQLREYFPDDAEVPVLAHRLETLLSSKKGELSDLIRKAEAALRVGRIIEPLRTSAYYYAREALAIDNQNAAALAVHQQVRARMLTTADQHRARGDSDAEIRQLREVIRYFSDDTETRKRLDELHERLTNENERATNPLQRRLSGLKKAEKGDFAGAVEDLEFAAENGQGTAEVVAALGDAYKELGRYDEAFATLGRLRPVVGEQYVTAQGLMGDMTARRGNLNQALEYYQEAVRRGGSVRYSIETLNDRIEDIEKRLRARAEAPTPVSIQVKHPHAFGSCKGTLRVEANGVFFTPTSGNDGFSTTILSVDPIVEGKKLRLRIQGKDKTFEGQFADLERFRAALNKYKTAAAAK